MKQIWIPLTLTVLSSLAFAQTSSPRKAYADFQSAKPEMIRRLNGLNKGSEGELRIRSIQMEELEAGTLKLNAKTFQIDLDAGESIKISGGGVIIGSGTDGLAATTNEDLHSPIVIQPPLDLNTTITIFGDPKETYCAHRMKTNPDGSLMQYGTSFSTNFQVCAPSGKPLRLIKAGTFLIWTASIGARTNIAIVSLQDSENKVIPLRQIIVPNHPGVEHGLQSDITSITEQEKFLVPAYASNDRTLIYKDKFLNSLGYAGKQMSFDEFKTHSLLLDSEPGGYVFGMKQYLHTNGSFSPSSVFLLAYMDPNFSDRKGGHTYYVFPGVYTLSWKIDGQMEKSTLGIHVQ